MADVRLEVWAPLATTVEAVLPRATDLADGSHAPAAEASASDVARPTPTRLPLTPGTDGNWTIDLAPGTDYLLSVDGGDPCPDPRSGRQPHGVHGPSRVFDPTAFAWTDDAWAGRDVLGGVLYELHVGTFTPGGTLDSAIERLGDLVDLGVDTVELMPLAPFPGERGWGYDGVSIYAVHEVYGGPEALQRFVDAAHGLGLAVCLDVVHNHFGPAGNYVATFGPYFTAKHHTPWGAAINLDDEHNAGVRAFIVDHAVRWLRDFHVDALRLDAVHALMDDSERHILAEIADAVAELEAATGRTLTLIAESDLNDVAMIAPTPAHPDTTGDPSLPATAASRGMDGQWADDVHHALHSWLTGETFGYYVDFGTAETLAHAFEKVFVHEGGLSTFRGTAWGAPVPDDVERRRFVTFTQNHDQVGNRGLGDRPDERLPAGAVAGGAALLLLSPFTPLLFQGQEWGTRRPFQFFSDHDPDLGALITAGRLQEFASHGWGEIYGPDAVIPDPQDEAAFAASVVDWAERDQPEHAAMLAWHRTLIELRRAHVRPGLAVATSHGEGWFALTHGPLTVVAAPREDAAVPLAGSLLASFGGAELAGGTLRLPAASVAVVGT